MLRGVLERRVGLLQRQRLLRRRALPGELGRLELVLQAVRVPDRLRVGLLQLQRHDRLERLRSLLAHRTAGRSML